MHKFNSLARKTIVLFFFLALGLQTQGASEGAIKVLETGDVPKMIQTLPTITKELEALG